MLLDVAVAAGLVGVSTACCGAGCCFGVLVSCLITFTYELFVVVVDVGVLTDEEAKLCPKRLNKS